MTISKIEYVTSMATMGEANEQDAEKFAAEVRRVLAHHYPEADVTVTVDTHSGDSYLVVDDYGQSDNETAEVRMVIQNAWDRMDWATA